MAETVNPEERRAYREGVVDQKLDGHDAKFAGINGSIDKLASAVVEVEKTLSRVSDQVQGMVVTMPSLRKLADDTATAAEIAEKVAAALRQKDDDEKQQEQEKRSMWERKREVVAWALGIVAVLATVTTLATRLLGIPAQAPAARTVTVQDITPGSP